MLRSLRIDHFKSIYHAQLEFGKANLFVGPNGAGKSNVLEALGVLAAALSKGLDPAGLDERGIRLSLPTMFKSAFKKTRLTQQFRLEARFDHGRYECSIRAGLKKPALEFHSEALYEGNVKVFGRGPNGINIDHSLVSDVDLDASLVDSTRGLWDVISPFAKISQELRDELDCLSGFNVYAPQTAVMRGVAVDARLKEPLGLTGSGLATAFSEALAQRNASPTAKQNIDAILSLIWEPGWADLIRVGAFDSSIVPSHIKSDGSLLYVRDKFMNTNRNFLSAFDASEGTLYLIFVATLLAHIRAPSVFALDNVDGTLNPRLVRRLANTIVAVCCGSVDAGIQADHKHQVFVTSHHPSALDSFDLFENNHAVFVAHRNLKSDTAIGSTTFDRLRPPPNVTKDEWADRSAGKSISTMLLEGLIPDAL